MVPDSMNALQRYFMSIPSIGSRTANRLAYHLYTCSAGDLGQLSSLLDGLEHGPRYCEECFVISDKARCKVCSNPKRDASLLCIVSDSRDLFSFERTGHFKGVYHVLNGLLDPLEGVGEDTVGIPALLDRIREQQFDEIIYAMSSSVMGEATIAAIQNGLQGLSLKQSRLAVGLPQGADLEFADRFTLAKAFEGRVPT